MKQFILIVAAIVVASCGAGTTGDDAKSGRTTLPSEQIESSAPPPPAKVIDVTGEACGGIAAIQCPTGFYCEHPKGQCIEMMDGAGTCQSQPDICTEQYDPVCGCDGKTYGNACDAASAGVSIASDGECASPDTQ